MGLKPFGLIQKKEIWDVEGIEKPLEFSSWQGLTEEINSLYN